MSLGNGRVWSAAGLLAAAFAADAAALPLERIRLPPGFEVAVYASGVDGARQLALGEQGTVFVGSLRAGKVHALIDADRDGTAERITTVAADLELPSGVTFRDGSLYVGAVNRILRYDEAEKRLGEIREPVVVTDALPRARHHGWKFLGFGPDGLLYVPVGAPCNVCETGDPYATILRMKPDGGGIEVFARGVRNTVGFDWDPRTKMLWFTDNGRDWLGDDEPPDELNSAPGRGLHFGFPHCHGTKITDPQLGGRDCALFRAAAQELDPHVAALGMRFYNGEAFPEEYRGRIFIAEHGSWNRSRPIGYRITTVAIEKDRASDYRVFAAGWLDGEEAWGRPADVLVMPDGALLVSDDQANAVYRIRYEAPRQGKKKEPRP
ncbi:MAG: PQQ-dependent sugar dehydrogenase [Candidatus Binatia bacterium]